MRSTLRKWRSLILARPTNITKECRGPQVCRSCDTRLEKIAQWPYGITPMWTVVNGVWLPMMLKGPMGAKRWTPISISGGAPEPYEGYGAVGLTTDVGDIATWVGTLPLVHVTSSADNGGGTLRTALQGGASTRLVVFDTPMTINLDNEIVVTGDHIVIDGSYIAGSGRSVGDAGIQVNQRGPCQFEYTAHDIVCTYLRSHQSLSGEQDCFQAYGGAYNIVFDHLSASEANDGCLDVTEGAHDITIQYCIFQKLGPDTTWTAHGNCITSYGANKVSFHHNLTSSPERNPHMDNRAGTDASAVGGTPPSAGTTLLMDVRCNLMWQWGDLNGVSYGTAVSVDGSNGAFASGGRCNVVKNLMKTTRTGGFGHEVELNHNFAETVSVFTSGNVNQSTDGVNIDAQGNAGAAIGSPPAITEHDALTAAAYVLTCSGCRPLNTRDSSLVATVSAGLTGLPGVTCGDAPDTTAPTITITVPTSNSTYTTNVSPL